MASKSLAPYVALICLSLLGIGLVLAPTQSVAAQEDNRWIWTVSKAVFDSPTSYTVVPGESINVGYRVTVDATASGNVTGSPDDLDDCGSVYDEYQGLLGIFCISQGVSLPSAIRYTLTFSFTEADCGVHQISNTATVTGTDTNITHSATEIITVTVNCDGGGDPGNGGGQACAHGYGFWKTHPEAWVGVDPNGGFFSSGQSYFTVMNTPPQGGNAYYILAHDYITAQLNQASGAVLTGDAQAAFNQATQLLSSYSPGQIAGMKGNSEVRRSFIHLAATLNSGSASQSCG